MDIIDIRKGLPSMVDRLFDEKSSGVGVKNNSISK